MTNYRSICLVKGYHEVTRVPALASEQDLSKRFAVVLSQYRPDLGEKAFDEVLFFAILREICNVIDHDELLAEIEGDTRCCSLADLHEKLLTTSEEDREPPRRIYFRKRGELTCLEETEFWTLCGGPAPYSDSLTLSFYTREECTNSLEVACAAACEQVSGVVEDIVEASPDPVRSPWWKRVLGKGR